MVGSFASSDGRSEGGLVLVPDTDTNSDTIDELTRELYQTHGRALLRFASKLTLGDTQRAEDIVQETLLRAWRHPEVLCARAEMRPWLFMVARRVAIDMWRRRSASEQIGAELQADDPDPADPIGEAITGLDVRAALATLSPEHRQVIVAIYYRCQSLVQAAEELGLAVGTVKSRTYYAIRALRRALDERGYFESDVLHRQPAAEPRLLNVSG